MKDILSNKNNTKKKKNKRTGKPHASEKPQAQILLQFSCNYKILLFSRTSEYRSLHDNLLQRRTFCGLNHNTRGHHALPYSVSNANAVAHIAWLPNDASPVPPIIIKKQKGRKRSRERPRCIKWIPVRARESFVNSEFHDNANARSIACSTAVITLRYMRYCRAVQTYDFTFPPITTTGIIDYRGARCDARIPWCRNAT